MSYPKLTPIIAKGTTEPRYLEDRFEDIANVKDFGAQGDGVTDDTLAIKAALESGQSPIFFPSGTYKTTSTILVNVANDIELILPLTAVIKPAASVTGITLDLRGADTYKVAIRGGYWDANNVSYAQVADTITLRNFTDVLVDGSIFYFAPDYLNTKRGDTGVSTIECYNVTVTKCKFYGAPDLGIYMTGGVTVDGTDNGGRYIVSQNHFVKCATGVSLKRETEDAVVSDNIFYRCGTGVNTAEATSGETVFFPGSSGVISNNIFLECTQSVTLIKTYNWIVLGNLFEDWGSDINGNPINSVALAAIELRGSEKVLVSGNYIVRKKVAVPALSRGIFLNSYLSTVDSVTYKSINNVVQNNVINGASIGIRELDTSNGPNIVSNNVFNNCTTELDLRAVGSGQPYHLFTTLDFPSIAAGGTEDLTSTVPGASPGDLVLSFPTTSAGFNASAVVSSWVSAANTVTTRVFNADPVNSIDPSSARWQIQVIKAGN